MNPCNPEIKLLIVFSTFFSHKVNIPYYRAPFNWKSFSKQKVAVFIGGG